MKNCIYLLLALFLLTGFLELQAQQAFLSSGGEGTGSGGTSSYSVGQMVYSTYNETGGTIQQGVQQPYFISTTGIDNEKIRLEFNVFPNPTKGQLVLNINDESQVNYVLNIYDLNGKLLESKTICESSTHIWLSNFSSSTYILNIEDNGEILKTFTIIKN